MIDFFVQLFGDGNFWYLFGWMFGWCILTFLLIAGAASIRIHEETFFFHKLSWKEKTAFLTLVTLAVLSFICAFAYFILLSVYIGTLIV